MNMTWWKPQAQKQSLLQHNVIYNLMATIHSMQCNNPQSHQLQLKLQWKIGDIWYNIIMHNVRKKTDYLPHVAKTEILMEKETENKNQSVPGAKYSKLVQQ